MLRRKHATEMPFERAYDLLEDVATPAEIRELGRNGKVRTEDVDRIRYNQPPFEPEEPQKRKIPDFGYA
jgi:hypothetical protein